MKLTKFSSLTYPGDFNCHKADATSHSGLSKAWWRDQMDQHSAKVVEIERITGLKELFNKVFSIKTKVTHC